MTETAVVTVGRPRKEVDEPMPEIKTVGQNVVYVPGPTEQEAEQQRQINEAWSAHDAELREARAILNREMADIRKKYAELMAKDIEDAYKRLEKRSSEALERVHKAIGTQR